MQSRIELTFLFYNHLLNTTMDWALYWALGLHWFKNVCVVLPFWTLLERDTVQGKPILFFSLANQETEKYCLVSFRHGLRDSIPPLLSKRLNFLKHHIQVNGMLKTLNMTVFLSMSLFMSIKICFLHSGRHFLCFSAAPASKSCLHSGCLQPLGYCGTRVSVVPAQNTSVLLCKDT